jgi:hypothetical protein
LWRSQAEGSVRPRGCQAADDFADDDPDPDVEELLDAEDEESLEAAAAGAAVADPPSDEDDPDVDELLEESPEVDGTVLVPLLPRESVR